MKLSFFFAACNARLLQFDNSAAAQIRLELNNIRAAATEETSAFERLVFFFLFFSIRFLDNKGISFKIYLGYQ